MKSIKEPNNNITKDNKTLTESFNNLLLQITTTNKTLLDNTTRGRNILNDINDDKLKNGNDCITRFIDSKSCLAIRKL